SSASNARRSSPRTQGRAPRRRRPRRRRRRGAEMPGQALWAYCVVGADDVAGLPALDGVEAGSRGEAIVDGDLAALVSAVPRPDYDDESLREHLNDLTWVERTARAHERV